MFALIAAQNKFFLTEHIIYTLLLAVGGLHLYYAFRALRQDHEDAVPPEARFFLRLLAGHVALQAWYHFVFPFGLLIYVQRFYVCIELLMLNLSLLGQLQWLSAPRRKTLEQAIMSLEVISGLLLLVAILRMHAAGECGQQLQGPYLIVLACCGLLTASLMIGINANINAEIAGLFGKGETLPADLDIGKIQALKHRQRLAVGVMATSGGVVALQALTLLAKYKKLGRPGATCDSLLADHSVPFWAVVSLTEFVAENALNCCLYYLFFYQHKDKLATCVDLNHKINEAFESHRSKLLEE